MRRIPNYTYILLLVFATNVKSAKLPDYIQKCSFREEIIHECIINQAQEVLSKIAGGDESLHLQSLSPFHVPEFSFTAQNIEIKLTDLEVFNLDRAKILDAWMKPKELLGFIEISCDVLVIQGTYDVSGKLLMVPIEQKGYMNVTLKNLHLNLTTNYVKVLKANKEYLGIRNSEMKYEFADVHIFADINFHGEIGNTVVSFINENWRDLFQDVKPGITSGIKTVLESTHLKIMGNIPLKDLFSQ